MNEYCSIYFFNQISNANVYDNVKLGTIGVCAMTIPKIKFISKNDHSDKFTRRLRNDRNINKAFSQ